MSARLTWAHPGTWSWAGPYARRSRRPRCLPLTRTRTQWQPCLVLSAACRSCQGRPRPPQMTRTPRPTCSTLRPEPNRSCPPASAVPGHEPGPAARTSPTLAAVLRAADATARPRVDLLCVRLGEAVISHRLKQAAAARELFADHGIFDKICRLRVRAGLQPQRNEVHLRFYRLRTLRSGLGQHRPERCGGSLDVLVGRHRLSHAERSPINVVSSADLYKLPCLVGNEPSMRQFAEHHCEV